MSMKEERAQKRTRHLDSMSYTLKTVKFEPERPNTLESKKKTKLFVEKLLEYQGLSRPIIFMDETNLNIHTYFKE